MRAAGLYDPFNRLDGNTWDFHPSITTADGALHIPAESDYPVATTDARFDLRDSNFTIEYNAIPPANADGSNESGIVLRLDGSNEVRFAVKTDIAVCRVTTAGVQDNAYPGFSPSNADAIRVRETGGTLFFEYRSSGTWNTLHQTSTTFDVSSVEMHIFSGNYTGAASTGDFVVTTANPEAYPGDIVVNAFPYSSFEYGVGTWAGNDVFGSFQPGTIERTGDRSYSGDFGGKATWPAPDGSGLQGGVSGHFTVTRAADRAGIWTCLAAIYVPTGEPDVQFGFTFTGTPQVVTAKDQWVIVRDTARVQDADNVFCTLATAGTSQAGTAYLGAVLATPGEYAGDYFDGSYVGAQWFGKPFESASSAGEIPEPEVYVEVAWTGNHAEINPVWTDITDYVEGFSTRAGRSTEIGSIESSVLNVTLDNHDGAFTAGNDASPFYPNVRPQRQMRVRAVDALGNEHHLYRGMVERWPTQYDGLEPLVTVTLTDVLDYFSSFELSPTLEYEMHRHDPEDVFPMDTDSLDWIGSSTKAFRTAVIRDTQYWDLVNYSGPKIETGSDNLIPAGAEGQTSIKFGNQQRKDNDPWFDIDVGSVMQMRTTRIRPTSEDFTFFGFFRLNNEVTPDDDPVAFCLTVDGDGDPNLSYRQMWKIYYDADAYTVENRTYGAWKFDLWQKNQPGDTFLTALVGANFPDGGTADPAPGYGEVAFLALNWDATNQRFGLCLNDRYVEHDISVFTNETPRNFVNDKFRWMAMGYRFPNGDSGGLVNGNLQYLAKYQHKVDGDSLKAIYAASQGRMGETADSRVNYILDQSGWPDALRDIQGPDRTTVERTTFQAGASALTKAQEVANDALALLYADGEGRIRYEVRDHRPKPNGVWMLDEATGTAIESGLLFEAATEDIVNVAHIDNAFGVKTTIRNRDSELEFGTRSKALALRVAEQDEAAQHGYHYVNRYGEPTVRISGVALNPSAAAEGALWPVVIGLRLSDRIRIGDLPGTAPESELDFFVESIRHEVVRDGDRLKWFTTLDVSPAPLRDAWVLGDAYRSQLGITTVPHF